MIAIVANFQNHSKRICYHYDSKLLSGNSSESRISIPLPVFWGIMKDKKYWNVLRISVSLYNIKKMIELIEDSMIEILRRPPKS